MADNTWVIVVVGSVTLKYDGAALQVCDTTGKDVLITFAGERLQSFSAALLELTNILVERKP